ncbi:hypothetical protein GpartN1_g1920.t1 [Galdieria partita]|uniref:Thymidylate kinase-like domain-containing protein n=1 Tax=Galdieria partita TaxID=83374 RepID=A0A9C7PTX5_9RHOD|nr:hypothetical protein GpartN1_g1920.t1 [Galdieria partita]
MIIAFEGIDGSGKTTLARSIANYFQATYVHFPRNPELSNYEMLLDRISFYYFEYLPYRKLTIVDRWSPSGYAYNEEEEKDAFYLDSCFFLVPHTCFFLDVDPAIAHQRRSDEETVQKLDAVNKKYKEIIKRLNVVVKLDAQETKQALFEQVKNRIQTEMNFVYRHSK